ncbi:MAG: response regulator [Acetobacteraceae bacterium]|nr:response regulator [Pseudomonadota bacterium]
MKLSTRLVLLVLGCLLPVVTAQVYSQVALHTARRDQISSIAIRQAAMANDEMAAHARAVAQLATVLTQFPDAITTKDGCRSRLTALRANLPPYRFLGLYDAGGTLICGSADAPAALQTQDPQWLARLADARHVEAGPIDRNSPTEAAFLPLVTALPLPGIANGRAVFVAGLDTAWLAKHLDEARSSYLRPVPDADLVLVDRQGTLIARLPGGRHDGEDKLPHWVMPLLGRATAGVETVANPQGHPYLIAYVPIAAEPIGVATIEALAMSNVAADVDRATLQDLLVLGTAALAALVLAWVAGRRFIYAPTEALLQAARRWRQGDLNARARLDDPRSEFGALAESFNAMAAGLQVREIERELQAGMLEAQVAERTRALSESNNRLQVEIAGRAKTEAALHQAQKLQAVGQLAGGIAHDFNNMLATVLGNLELIERRFTQTDRPWTEADRERILRLAARAVSAVQRGSRLTSRLLTFSRRQQLSPRPTDISALVRDIIPLAAVTLGSRIQITADLQDGLPLAMADPGQVEAALLNLCLNARDAMPAGGTVTIRSAAKSSLDVEQDDEAHHLPPGDYVQIIVADTGCGMSAEVMARAFDPFFTTKGPSGTGLGLSQVYGMARQSGGDVTIRSQLEQGTQITLYLPKADAVDEAISGEADEPRPLTDRRDELALVVDDDHEVRQVTVDILSHLGFRVVEAAGGDQALDVVAASERPMSLILLDYAMPGMNGLQLAQALRLRGVTAPIILVTGYAELSGADLAAGLFRDVLHKPFTIQELQDLVAQPGHAIHIPRPVTVSNDA